MTSPNANLDPASPAAADTPPPIKPHPRQFLLLLVVFIAWVAFLLWLYFATVYPLRHPHP